MTGPEHFRRAEELAAEAHKLLGQGDDQATAGVWAAVAQAHAVLASPPPPRWAHRTSIAAHGSTLPGPGSSPACSLRGRRTRSAQEGWLPERGCQGERHRFVER
jgi:hypothetical protein